MELQSPYPAATQARPRMLTGRGGRYNHYSLARSWYSPIVGFTRILSPVLMNSGTLIVTPFSSLAGFDDAFFVAVFMTGAVSTISRVSEFGRRMPIGRPS